MQSGYVTKGALPPYTGVSPRVTSQNYQSYRGKYVSIIFVLHEDGQFTCGATGKVLALTDVPATVEVSRVSEFICYVDLSTGDLVYFQHALLDDEFDFEVYRRLLKVSSNFPELF